MACFEKHAPANEGGTESLAIEVLEVTYIYIYIYVAAVKPARSVPAPCQGDVAFAGRNAHHGLGLSMTHLCQPRVIFNVHMAADKARR